GHKCSKAPSHRQARRVASLLLSPPIPPSSERATRRFPDVGHNGPRPCHDEERWRDRKAASPPPVDERCRGLISLQSEAALGFQTICRLLAASAQKSVHQG